MSDVTRILDAIRQGDSNATEQLLPLVYEELRKLAAHKMAKEVPGQTLQPTALVHEAYLRLVGAQDRPWNSRGHFFAAAAEAMRRILVENARRKQRVKHGGGLQRTHLTSLDVAITRDFGGDMPPPFIIQKKTSGWTTPPASEVFSFIDVHEDVIDEGTFALASPSEWGHFPATRHSGGFNSAFVDGHAAHHRLKYTGPRSGAPINGADWEDFTWITNRMTLH